MAYYAVIFRSQLSSDTSGYEATAGKMLELAAAMPGFLGVESARDENGGLTVSYWESLEAIDRWRKHPEHLQAKAEGKSRWYSEYKIRIARIDTPWTESST